MIKIALVIGLAFVIQFVLSSFQMKNFNNEFVRLRRKGKVAIGRKSGGFHAGAIVMAHGKLLLTLLWDSVFLLFSHIVLSSLYQVRKKE